MLKMDACKNDMSGLLNSSLALSELGSVKKLRDALTSIFFAEMDVVQCEPPQACKEYRRRVFDAYLPVTDVLRPLEKINLKRRYILAAVLNGHINKEKIQHFCLRGCCQNAEESLCNAALFLTWALIPFACPVLCRKSWIGQLGNLHWVALLESHHCLFAKLLARFFGKPSAPVTTQHPQRDEWLAVLQDEVSAGRAQVQVDQVDGAAAEDPQLVAPERPVDVQGAPRNEGAAGTCCDYWTSWVFVSLSCLGNWYRSGRPRRFPLSCVLF